MIELFIPIFLAAFFAFFPGFHQNFLVKVLPLYGWQLDVFLGFYFSFSVYTAFLYSSSQDYASSPYIFRLIREDWKNMLVKIGTSIALAGLFSLFIPVEIFKLSFAIKPYLPWIVLILLAITIKKWSLLEIFIFVVSGILGYFALLTVEDPYFPLFTGFYALPVLLFAAQTPLRGKPPKRISIVPSIIGIFLGIFALLVPSMSSPSFFAALLPLKGEDFIQVYYAISATQLFLAKSNFDVTGSMRVGVAPYISSPWLLILSAFLGLLLLPLIFSIRFVPPKFVLISFLIVSLFQLGLISFFYFMISAFLGLLPARDKRCYLGAVILPTLYFMLFK